MGRRPTSESRWGGPKVAVGALLALAAALRVVGIDYGLPFALLDADERKLVPRAWSVFHADRLEPASFETPSLAAYLLAPFQAWAGGPSYLSGRIGTIVLALATVAASWWLGRRAYGLAAGAIAAAAAAVATNHVLYSHVAVFDVPLALFVTAALGLMVARQLELAGFAAGLAIGVGYGGVVLIVPLVAAAWRRWWRLAGALALAALAFVLSNPYVVTHVPETVDGLERAFRLARDAPLTARDESAVPLAAAAWDALGPALAVAAAGLVLALVRRAHADRVLAAFVLAESFALLVASAHVDRRLLPLVPALGALAGRLRGLGPVTLLLLVVPLTWAIQDVRGLTHTDTRVVAARWIERNVPRGARVAVDPGIPRQSRFALVPLSPPASGHGFDPRRDVGALVAAGVRFVVVNGAVATAVRAARSRYRREARFYDALDRRATRAYAVQPGDDLAGPWVVVYRLPLPGEQEA